MNYPSTPTLMLTFLRQAAKAGTTIDEVLEVLHTFVTRIQPRDPESLLPTRVDTDGELRARLEESAVHLKEAGLLTVQEGPNYAATGRGKRLLEQNPSGIDDTVLERFLEFRRFIASRRDAMGPTEPTRDYKDGFNKYQDGCELADNPYDPETAAYQEWNAGWFEAFEEHLDHHRDGSHFPHIDPA